MCITKYITSQRYKQWWALNQLNHISKHCGPNNSKNITQLSRVRTPHMLNQNKPQRKTNITTKKHHREGYIIPPQIITKMVMTWCDVMWCCVVVTWCDVVWLWCDVTWREAYYCCFCNFQISFHALTFTYYHSFSYLPTHSGIPFTHPRYEISYVLS